MKSANALTVMALVAASTCAASVYASGPGGQPKRVAADFEPRVAPGRAVVRGPDPAGFPSHGSPRTLQVVYDNLSNTFAQSPSTIVVLGAGGVNILDDISFAPGPWATATTRLATEISYGLQYSGTTAQGNFDVLMSFYAAASFPGFTANPMLSGAAFQTVRFPIANLNPNFVYQFTSSLTGLPGGGLSFPGPSVAMQVRLVNPAGDGSPSSFMYSDTNPTGQPNLSHNPAGQPTTQIVFPALALNPISPGSSSVSYGRDVNMNGIFEGGPGPNPGGAFEHRFISGTAGGNQSYMVRFKGDASVPTPAVFTDLGALADGITTPPTTTLPPGTVKWYKIHLNGDATDAASKFLDIDTEGSMSDFVDDDLAIGLYDNGGSLIASDQNDGSGLEAQLTFGIGRRAAVGDGLQYDGRDGELLSGDYWLAVGYGPGTSFGGGFTAVNSNPSITVNPLILHLNTNVNTGNLGPAVAPVVDQDLGVTASADGTPATFSAASIPTGLHGIRWFKFTVPAGSSAPVSNFLDISMEGGTCIADTEMGLYTSTGAFVATDDDSGGTNTGHSQLSFGNTSSPRDYSAVDPACLQTGGLPAAGQNGNIGAGTYYIAVGLFDTTFGATRWTVRSNSGSNLNVAVNVHTNIQQGPPCPVDINGDGAVNVGDFLAFLQLYSAGDLRADMNGSGAVNVSDFLLFLQLYAAGC